MGQPRSPRGGYRFTVICGPLDDGGYQVIVPALPEAKEMAGDAIACHLRGLLKDNEEIPEDPFAFAPPEASSRGGRPRPVAWRSRTIRVVCLSAFIRVHRRPIVVLRRE